MFYKARAARNMQSFAINNKYQAARQARGPPRLLCPTPSAAVTINGHGTPRRLAYDWPGGRHSTSYFTGRGATHHRHAKSEEAGASRREASCSSACSTPTVLSMGTLPSAWRPAYSRRRWQVRRRLQVRLRAALVAERLVQSALVPLRPEQRNVPGSKWQAVSSRVASGAARRTSGAARCPSPKRGCSR